MRQLRQNPTDRRRRPAAARAATRWWWRLNVAGLLLVAVWFRVDALGNLPGLNGDEAWYGVRAQQLLAGRLSEWRTPTGNPLNPWLLLPLTAAEWACGPSVVALRLTAVVSGLAALALNWWLARWVFDRRTAWLTTVMLAVLPLDIAYSRFAWDASQSLPATLLVCYLSLAALRRPATTASATGSADVAARPVTVSGRWSAAAVAALLVAVWIHPTNVFAAAALVAVAGEWLRTRRRGVRENCPAKLPSPQRTARGRISWAIAPALAVPSLAAVAWWFYTSGPPILAERLTGIRDLSQPGGLHAFAILYPRLFLGETVYAFLAGSHAWLAWPATSGWGIDVVLFWVVLLCSTAVLARRAFAVGRPGGPRAAAKGTIPLPSTRKTGQSPCGLCRDRAVLLTWAITVLGFLLAAGPSGLVPGYERYGVCLVVPTVLLIARACARPHRRWVRAAMLATPLLGWLLLADFQQHYFRFIAETGGQAHLAFRTAAVEPKQAALDLVLQQSHQGTVQVATSQYWLYWPLRYFAGREPEVQVLWADATGLSDGASPTNEVAWRIEFTDTPAGAALRRQRAGRGERTVADCSGRAVISVFAPTANCD